MRNPEKTFHWIISILKNKKVPFVVTGGLAAKSYGSQRALNDIDIDIPDEYLEKIVDDVKPYIIFGPKHAKDRKWDMLIMNLNHEGQEIDLSGGDTLKISDPITGVWIPSPTDFSDVENREIFGITVPVASRKSLAGYKSLLDGDHQKVDIEAILNVT